MPEVSGISFRKGSLLGRVWEEESWTKGISIHYSCGLCFFFILMEACLLPFFSCGLDGLKPQTANLKGILSCDYLGYKITITIEYICSTLKVISAALGDYLKIFIMLNKHYLYPVWEETTSSGTCIYYSELWARYVSLRVAFSLEECTVAGIFPYFEIQLFSYTHIHTYFLHCELFLG